MNKIHEWIFVVGRALQGSIMVPFFFSLFFSKYQSLINQTKRFHTKVCRRQQCGWCVPQVADCEIVQRDLEKIRL